MDKLRELEVEGLCTHDLKVEFYSVNWIHRTKDRVHDMNL